MCEYSTQRDPLTAKGMKLILPATRIGRRNDHIIGWSHSHGMILLSLLHESQRVERRQGAHYDDEAAQRSSGVYMLGVFDSALGRPTGSVELRVRLITAFQPTYCRRSMGELDVEAFDDVD
ncbi:hypothetical protein CCMA1212_010543 [Trichoderma ghanense]|uniref:Uncharacterized protein n=1 Tax=Trichoderma ghanense TaxID=65468 RepID=A0ABY2GQD0_9HYPO